MFHLFTFQWFRWTIPLRHDLPSTKMPLFVDETHKAAGLFLLQRLGRVGAHEAEGLCGDSGDDYRQYDCQC